MSIYLKIGETDVSRYITENEYKVTSVPVYDEESAFVNICGQRICTRTGMEVTITAKLYDVDDTCAAALSSVLSYERIKVSYSAPELSEAEFETVKSALSLDRVCGGEKFWTAEISMKAFIPDDCL